MAILFILDKMKAILSNRDNRIVLHPHGEDKNTIFHR